ncbi:hypothetical protein DdX_15642 [Ditylenchus destructor]|uniref:Uncharacterized protein n=1 Tax=Ditylenchus destructor TaxID=166010 RepID=A0AAD4QXH7_9BILA|nr:hypothetical protein DdX_15642 [Ditylenchus destructor]
MGDESSQVMNRPASGISASPTQRWVSYGIQHSLIINVGSNICIKSILKKSLKSLSTNLSHCMSVYLAFSWIMALVSIPNHLYVVINMIAYQNYAPYTIYWLGLWPNVCYGAITVPVVFLSVERCLAIRLAARYSPQNVKLSRFAILPRVNGYRRPVDAATAAALHLVVKNYAPPAFPVPLRISQPPSPPAAPVATHTPIARHHPHPTSPPAPPVATRSSRRHPHPPSPVTNPSPVPPTSPVATRTNAIFDPFDLRFDLFDLCRPPQILSDSCSPTPKTPYMPPNSLEMTKNATFDHSDLRFDLFDQCQNKINDGRYIAFDYSFHGLSPILSSRTAFGYEHCKFRALQIAIPKMVLSGMSVAVGSLFLFFMGNIDFKITRNRMIKYTVILDFVMNVVPIYSSMTYYLVTHVSSTVYFGEYSLTLNAIESAILSSYYYRPALKKKPVPFALSHRDEAIDVSHDQNGGPTGIVAVLLRDSLRHNNKQSKVLRRFPNNAEGK